MSTYFWSNTNVRAETEPNNKYQSFNHNNYTCNVNKQIIFLNHNNEVHNYLCMVWLKIKYICVFCDPKCSKLQF